MPEPLVLTVEGETVVKVRQHCERPHAMCSCVYCTEDSLGRRALYLALHPHELLPLYDMYASDWLEQRTTTDMAMPATYNTQQKYLKSLPRCYVCCVLQGRQDG